jgi:hypothetical protein
MLLQSLRKVLCACTRCRAQRSELSHDTTLLFWPIAHGSCEKPKFTREQHNAVHLLLLPALPGQRTWPLSAMICSSCCSGTSSSRRSPGTTSAAASTVMTLHVRLAALACSLQQANCNAPGAPGVSRDIIINGQRHLRQLKRVADNRYAVIFLCCCVTKTGMVEEQVICVGCCCTGPAST